jgi:hypothetical protein
VDVGICVDSGFQILSDTPDENGLYHQVAEFDAFGNQEVVALARSIGSCSTCDNGRDRMFQTHGFRATAVGNIMERDTGAGGVPLLEVERLLEASVSCDDIMAQNSESSTIPTSAPSHLPSYGPTSIAIMTELPSVGPTTARSSAPTSVPTGSPSMRRQDETTVPTLSPSSDMSSRGPSNSPSTKPSVLTSSSTPTSNPTESDEDPAETMNPTPAPSAFPSSFPSLRTTFVSGAPTSLQQSLSLDETPSASPTTSSDEADEDESSDGSKRLRRFYDLVSFWGVTNAIALILF